MNEARRSCTIVNQRGLHARASAKFVNTVAALPGGYEVRVVKDCNEAGGGSILGLMMLGAAKGDTIEVRVKGDGDGRVLEQLCTLVGDGFGED